MRKLWIDFNTGTWGSADSLAVFDPDEVPLALTGGMDVESYLELSSDSEINTLGADIFIDQLGGNE
jgi:hypothetical protein